MSNWKSVFCYHPGNQIFLDMRKGVFLLGSQNRSKSQNTSPMWQADIQILSPQIQRFRLTYKSRQLSNRQFIDQVKGTTDFVLFFNQLLREVPFKAFFWEVKAITAAQLDEPFEFVMVESSMLSGISANASAFQRHFFTEEPVVSFPNLGGDAHLIVPTPMADDLCYAHLASFVRNAQKEQIIAFWQCVGMEWEKQLGDQPKWLSTAGLGVAWLHVRIDSRPKYYRYSPYKSL